LQYLLNYHSGQRLVLFWDGASYHRSKELKTYLHSVNEGLPEDSWLLRCFRLAPNAPLAKSSRRYLVAGETVSEDSPVLHLDLDYSIRGNRTGLLALIDAAAMALAAQSKSEFSVFDFQADKHSLQVSLCHNHNGKA
jgi:hypothetical protein